MKAPSSLRFLVMLATLLGFASLALASSSSVFCKCTCFGDSFIIDLNGGSNTTPVPGPDGSSDKIARTCSDCTKASCLGYNLPNCKNAEEKDVFTACFRRDSAKDQAIVFIFIFATVGLLIYAGAQPWIDHWREKLGARQLYTPLPGQSNR